MKTEKQRYEILNGLYHWGPKTVKQCSNYIFEVGKNWDSHIIAATQRIKELEKEGLVNKVAFPEDGRKKLVSITEKGRIKCKEIESNPIKYRRGIN